MKPKKNHLIIKLVMKNFETIKKNNHTKTLTKKRYIFFFIKWNGNKPKKKKHFVISYDLKKEVKIKIFKEKKKRMYNHVSTI